MWRDNSRNCYIASVGVVITACSVSSESLVIYGVGATRFTQTASRLVSESISIIILLKLMGDRCEEVETRLF